MSKLIAIGLVWLLLFAVTLILIDEQLSIDEPGQTPDDRLENSPTDRETSGAVALLVSGDLVNSFWERGISDLPSLSATFNYVVENVGNTSADDVNIEITLDSSYYSAKTVHDLSPGSEFTDSTSFSVYYDQSMILEVEARCGNVSSSWSYILDAELPRQPSWSLSKLYITPDEQYVESVLRKIVSGFVPVHWVAIRDWVGKTIEYTNDYESHNVNEYWQLGKETLESRTGDCEDFAILLCSLLRADGWSADEVYVVIGQNEAGDYHAWVKIKILPLVDVWYNIEPQGSGLYTGPGDILTLSGYTAICNFNDQRFIGL